MSYGTLPLNLQVPTPAKRDLSMVYLEAFRHSTIVVRVELLVGQGALSPDAVAFEDPEATTGTSLSVRTSCAPCCLPSWKCSFSAELYCGAIVAPFF